MPNFLNKVMNTGAKAKLQAESAMIERELKALKHKFGVELYDLLQKQEKTAAIKNMTAPGSLRARIKDIYKPAHNEIVALQQKKKGMQAEKLHHEVSRERGIPAITAGEKMASARNVVVSSGKEAQLMAQIAMVDRDIKKRKEKFGIDVFEHVKHAKGIKCAMAKAVGSVSETEKRIQQCVERTARNVESIQRRKSLRESEIKELDSEGTIQCRRKSKTNCSTTANANVAV